jgi:hypothetical protein
VKAPREQDLARIRKAAAAVGVRLRLGHALSVLTPTLVIALASIAVTLAAHRAFPMMLSAARVSEIATGLLALALVAPVVAFARPLPPRAGTAVLDRHHGLRGRLTAALSFAESPPACRTALMELAIEDACARSSRLAPGEAAPLNAPAGLLLAGGIAMATVAAARLQTAAPDLPGEAPAPRQARLDAVTLGADEIESLRDAVTELARGSAHPDPAVRRFGRLVEDLGAGKLDREGALRRIRWIERSLDRGEGPARALRERLADLRDLIRQPGDPARARRAAAFGWRARGATGGEGDPGEAGDHDGDGDEAPDLGPAPAEPPPRDPALPAPCAGGSEPGDEGDPPRHAGRRGGEPKPGVRPPRAQASSPLDEAGTHHDPATAGEPQRLAGTARDVRAHGPDTGRGKSRRQVILAAAERGFRGAGYRDTFVEYRTVAREHLEQDRIPDGRRFYVRRYFELIRPPR